MTESDEMKAFLQDPKKYFANELEAAMKEGKRKASRAKITMVGPGRAGKTCVARSFLNMEFENTPSTQGIDDLGLRTTVHQAEAREGRWGEFREFDKMYEGYMAQQIHDKRRGPYTREYRAGPPAPNPTFIGAVSAWTRALTCLRMMICSTSASSSPVSDLSPNGASDSAELNRSPPLPSIPVDEEYVQRTIGEIRSDGLGLVVSIHDFGGQRVFDVIHSFFLGPNGVYVVVFNMEWMLPSSAERTWCMGNFTLWFNNLAVHSSVSDKNNNLLNAHR